MKNSMPANLRYAAACAFALMSASALAGQITLYEHTELRGESITTRDPLASVERTRFHETASSAVVGSGTWEVCTKRDFGGRCAQLVPGTYRQLRGQLSGPVASVREIAYVSAAAPLVISPDAVGVVTSPPVASVAYYEPAPVGVVTSPRVTYYAPGPVVVASGTTPIAGPVVVASGATPIVVSPDARPVVVATETRPVAYVAPIAVPAGPLMILYQHTPSGIRAVRLGSNIDDLGARQFGDAADSALVSGGTWRLCDGVRGSGLCADYAPGEYASLQSFNGRAKSAYLVSTLPSHVAAVTVAPPGRAVLYEYPNFGGRSAVVEFGRAPDLDWAQFRNPAASLRIESGTWLLCSNLGYEGDCRILQPGEYPTVTAMFSNGISSARQVWSPVYGSAGTYGAR